MVEEQITMLYPTLVKEGLVVSHYLTPDSVFYSNKYPTKCSFYLTSNMYLNSSKEYLTQLDVKFEGDSLIADSDNNNERNQLTSFMFAPVSDTHFVIGASLFIEAITIEKPGIYEIEFTLLEDSKTSPNNILDSKSCFFIASNAAGN